jgi:hypothetical protein
MALNWVRLDAGIASHDKVLHLLSDPSPKRWQAAASYMFALGWSGSHGTDGHIPTAALPFVHGTSVTARLLEKYGLWVESSNGWDIRNYAERQQLAVVTEARSKQARKAACTRHHTAGCKCWEDG